MLLKIKKINLSLKNVYFYFFLFSCSVASAQTFRAGSVTTDMETVKDTFGQWGTTAAGIAIIISASIGVASLILPWRFLKEQLGRPAWIGLGSALLIFIVMSFFGNSIHQYLTSMYQCPLQIISFPCS